MTSYTTSKVAAECRQIAVGIVGEAALDELAQALLDLETPPMRLGRATGIVGELFEAIRERVSAYIEGLDEEPRAALAETFPDTGYRRDLARSLAALRAAGHVRTANRIEREMGAPRDQS